MVTGRPSATASDACSAASAGSETIGTAVVSSRSSAPGRISPPATSTAPAPAATAFANRCWRFAAGRQDRRAPGDAADALRVEEVREHRAVGDLAGRALGRGERRTGRDRDRELAARRHCTERRQPAPPAPRRRRRPGARPPRSPRCAESAAPTVSASAAPPGAPTVPKPRPARPSLPAGATTSVPSFVAPATARASGLSGKEAYGSTTAASATRSRVLDVAVPVWVDRALEPGDQRVAVAELCVRPVGRLLPAEDPDREDPSARGDPGEARRAAARDDDPGHPRAVRSPCGPARPASPRPRRVGRGRPGRSPFRRGRRVPGGRARRRCREARSGSRRRRSPGSRTRAGGRRPAGTAGPRAPAR